jgi:hypothetical protein
MPTETRRTAAFDIHPDEIADAYKRFGFAALSDDQLFALAAAVVAVPRQNEANSFVLHAPLELMARRLLLPLVPPSQREAVRTRIMWIAARYAQCGEPVPADAPLHLRYGSVGAARQALEGALNEGDRITADRAARELLHAATLDEAMTLLAPVLDSLAAAGHAPIGFFLASRLAATSRAALALLRPLLTELARAPELRIHWVDSVGEPRGDEASLMGALADTPPLGLPGSDFIFPLVDQVDDRGVARDLLEPTRPADVAGAARATLRVAAHSMLQDDPEFAPYGWTHCLTLPQAIFEVIPWLPDVHRASAIAATYVVGFRAAESKGGLRIDWQPAPVAAGLRDALDDDPKVAAAAWYHASDADVAAMLPELVGRAASHEDAHLAKYTLACLAARERDRAAAQLYLAAAASLVAWWGSRRDGSGRDDL